MVSAGYSTRQIALHWIVFALVAFQFLAGDNMTDLFRASHGGSPWHRFIVGDDVMARMARSGR